METRHKPVFLSHSRKNADIMKEVAGYLEEKGIPCWYAPRNIQYGEKYDLEIAVAIEEVVGVVVVLITEELAESEFVPKEITLALRYSKKVIPLIIDGSPIPKSLEFKLANIQWLDMADYNSEEEALDELTSFLEIISRSNEVEHEDNVPKRVKKPVVLNQGSSSNLFQVESQTPLKVKAVFEPPSSFSLMEFLLNKYNILYLHNPQHVGKYTSAIALYEKLGLNDIFEWSKEVTFSQIISHPIKPESGFIVEIDFVTEFFKHFSDQKAEEFFRKLKEKNAYLILLSKEEATIDILSNCSVFLESPVNREKIMINHTRWLNLNDEITAKMVDWITSRKAADILPKEIYPRQAVEYVHKIHQLVIGEITENIFIQSIDESVSKRLKEWFKQGYSIRDISFYLTISLFQGQTYQSMIEKSEELLNIFLEHFKQDLAYETVIPSRDEYLQQFHAEVRKCWKQTNAGREPMDGVFLSFSQDITAIWEYIWLQFPSYQAPLVKWLHLLHQKSPRGIEEDMKRLIVHLMKKDSENVRNQIILPLANSDQHTDRLFAARILEELARDEDFLHLVFTLVKSWVRLTNNNRLQWTAIVLLGSSVGQAYYSKSLSLLRVLFGTKSYSKLLFPIQRSFEQLSHLALKSKEHEKLFYRFFIDWFSDLEEEELIEPLQFTSKLFRIQPKLFFTASKEWQNEFWKEFLRICYVKKTTRTSVEALINQWIITALGDSDRQYKVTSLLYSLYLVESVSNQSRLERLIERGLKNDKELYFPIHQQLISM